MPRALGVPAHAPLWLKRAQRLLVSLLAAVFVWLSIINQQDPMVIRSAVNIPVPCRARSWIRPWNAKTSRIR